MDKEDLRSALLERLAGLERALDEENALECQDDRRRGYILRAISSVKAELENL